MFININNEKSAGKIYVLSRFFIALKQLHHFDAKSRQRAKYGVLRRVPIVRTSERSKTIKKLLFSDILRLQIFLESI